jgi:flagellar motor protein MotB
MYEEHEDCKNHVGRSPGTSKQVASDTTKEGQAENRRVVVKILQNKGIAGT